MSTDLLNNNIFMSLINELVERTIISFLFKKKQYLCLRLIFVVVVIYFHIITHSLIHSEYRQPLMLSQFPHLLFDKPLSESRGDREILYN